MGRARGLIVELILDTCVLLYVKGKQIEGEEPDFKTKKARKILIAIRKGLHTGLISPPVLMEAYYIISDTYNESIARDFIKGILSTDGIFTVELSEEMGMIAGEFYFKYNTMPKSGLTEEEKKKLECPSACDCLVASINKYRKKYTQDTCVCTTDRKIKDISEISCDFYDIPTRITIEQPSN